ncbi:MAG: sigma-70 family RNA polymerase sigma factor [Lachnospiraceae bacterium]|nr:sigma-70 family RNA polymerase sigma factor [Lachnospiraceae bacterium]
MMTLKELKESVPEAPRGIKLPTTRQLMESGAKTVIEEMFGDAMLSVFTNGYVLYERIGVDSSAATVFRLHSCEEYLYDAAKEQDVGILSDELFECEEWFLRLLLEGEDRLARNSHRRYYRRVSRYDLIDSEWTDYLLDMSMNPENICLRWEEQGVYGECLSCMTERQREIVDLYYGEGMTMGEIADYYHVTRQYISKVIRNAIWKARAGCSVKKRPIPRGVRNKKKD